MQELWPLSWCCKASFSFQDGEYQASSWDASLLHCDLQSSCLKQSSNLNSSVIIKGKDESNVPLKYCEDLIYDGAEAAPSTYCLPCQSDVLFCFQRIAVSSLQTAVMSKGFFQILSNNSFGISIKIGSIQDMCVSVPVRLYECLIL